MAQEERYDFVIVGGGPNGTAMAAYLGKCGASVCILEERPEAGGACENTEPIPGVHINPHAVYMYAGPAPGFEQLELYKYGFRMNWSPMIETLAKQQEVGVLVSDGVAPITDKDLEGWAKLCGMLTDPPFLKELLRATHWCPPHPPEVEVTAENIPYMQVYKKHAPDIWTEELLDMTLFDLMDEYCETEPWKVLCAAGSWYSGAAGHYEGVAIPALAGQALVTVYSGFSVPRGGMHGYFHSIIRCALSHGVVIRTCCPVDEILVENGRAVGVRLRETATTDEKKVWANKAVISGTGIHPTFLKLINPAHTSSSLRKKVKDINIKGGCCWVSHLLTKEPLMPREKFLGPGRTAPGEFGGAYPCDSRDIYYEHVADVEGRKGAPSVPHDKLLWMATHSARFPESEPQCTMPGAHLTGPYYTYVPPPDYEVDGPGTIDHKKDEVNAHLRKAFSEVLENLDDDNLITHFVSTPWESEYRNTGILAGHFGGARHCADQWAELRPIPELSRYRTPIEGLYLCNQTSGHPGGLCLMAIPYNLMHILIEDGLVEPGDWWYPSPWYIPQEGKISAVPNSKEGESYA